MMERDAIRARYDQAAGTSIDPMIEGGGQAGCSNYGADELVQLPEGIRDMSLGCANPVQLASLQSGETVLDLGSGAGLDVLLAARRVGATGKVFGLDMSDAMLALARGHQRKAGIDNVEFIKGVIEEIPLPSRSVDVVVSNCVVNLSSDKTATFSEVFRVLRPQGRLAIADVIDEEPSRRDRATILEASPCLDMALDAASYTSILDAVGFSDIEIVPSHYVAPGFASAFVRAFKPAC